MNEKKDLLIILLLLAISFFIPKDPVHIINFFRGVPSIAKQTQIYNNEISMLNITEMQELKKEFVRNYFFIVTYSFEGAEQNANLIENILIPKFKKNGWIMKEKYNNMIMFVKKPYYCEVKLYKDIVRLEFGHLKSVVRLWDY